MAEIDPALRDIIVKTGTIVERMDEEFKEHKTIMNARLRDAKQELQAHKDDTKDTFEKHDARIEQAEHFRTKIRTYVGIFAAGGAVVIELIILGGKKLFGV